MEDRLENELRLKLPGIGRACDYRNSRSAAVKLFCYACQGGSRKEAAACRTYACPLWGFRPGADTRERPPGTVPDLATYDALAAEKTPEHLTAER